MRTFSPGAVTLWLAAALVFPATASRAKEIRHFVFFNRDRERISSEAFLTNTVFAGAQLKYTWRELEPAQDRYDFDSVRTDLQFLQKHGKQLFIQLQDSSFDDGILNVPEYLLLDPAFHGGADRQYTFKDGDEAKPIPAGWVARRWDPAVQRRFHRLLAKLGREFDGKIEGINLPETSLDFGESGRWYPAGFTPEIYRSAILTNLAELRKAFPVSVVIQYANFMPGEWLPENDHSLLRSVFEEAIRLNAGLGGPDLLPFKPGQMKHSYPLIRGASASVTTGIAVQWGNYEYKNPKSGKSVTIPELLDFARDYLGVTYVFWCAQEPYYSSHLIPFLIEQQRQKR